MLDWAEPFPPPAPTSFPASPTEPCFQHLLPPSRGETWPRVLESEGHGEGLLKRQKTGEGSVQGPTIEGGRSRDRLMSQAWALEKPGLLVSVGPAEPTALFRGFIRVPLWGEMIHCVHSPSAPVCSSSY